LSLSVSFLSLPSLQVVDFTVSLEYAELFC
jgi:hypothetical protein